jgi:hypothetical protein
MSAKEMNVVIGITLLKSATPYFSPTFGRGGLAALFACEVLQVGTGGTLDIEVEHKNPEDVTFSSLGSFTQLTAAGVGTKDLVGVKEQVRFSYLVGGAQAWSYVHFNMLAPAWRPY